MGCQYWSVSPNFIEDIANWGLVQLFSIPMVTLLASGSADQTVKLWKVDTGLCFKTLFGHTNPVTSIYFGSE